MRIADDSLLAAFRCFGRCEWCKKQMRRYRTEAAHIFSKGSGGSDVWFNVCALGPAFECACHRSHHDGNRPTREDLLALKAAQLKVLQDDIEDCHWLLWRLPKETTAANLSKMLPTMTAPQRKLLRPVVEQLRRIRR